MYNLTNAPMATEISNSTIKWRSIIYVLIGLSIIFLIYTVAFYFIYHYLYIEDTEAAGQFGDMFGSVNSLFSALAFLVISISLYLQNQELKLQRKQLEQQRLDSIDTRTMQLKSQEAQRLEIELTRHLHAKNNFESKFMFLLQNLERQIGLAHGGFLHEIKDGLTILHGHEYFDQLYKEITELNKMKPIGGGQPTHVDRPYMNRLLNHYSLFSNNDYWTQRHIEPIEDFSKTLILLIHNKRKTEYYNSWITFRSIIKTLQSEYLSLRNSKMDSEHEIDKNFEVYTELIKSVMPFSARIFYLYLNLLDGNDPCNSLVYRKLFENVETPDFFHLLHKEILFKKS